MMIHASRWGVRATALRTLAPGFTLAAWVALIPLCIEMWIYNCCDAFALEVPRKLFTRYRGHDPDHSPGRLGANNNSSTDCKPGSNGDYTLRILFALFKLRGLRLAAPMIIP
jgi:hypothetical protein